MRRNVAALVRAKGGQKVWSPLADGPSRGAANSLSIAETRQLVMRPLPAADSVEYQEDFGRNVMTHREYYPKRSRHGLNTFHDVPLAFSATELRSGRRQLAGIMNSERSGQAIGAKRENIVEMKTSFSEEGDGTAVEDHRYLFDTRRIEYCERFGRHLPDLHALAEACAIIYGCSTGPAREAYYGTFLRLDENSLQADVEKVKEDAELAAERLHRAGGSGSTEMVAAGNRGVGEDTVMVSEDLPIDVMPPEFADDGDDDDGDGAEPAEVPLPSSPELAPLAAAFEAYERGEIPTVIHSVDDVVLPDEVRERLRWRKLMEKLVAEEYDTLAGADEVDAAALNDQLHASKHIGIRLGATLKSALARQHQERGGTVHREQPQSFSAGNPDADVDGRGP